LTAKIPGAKRGRPKGSTSAQPTLPNIPARVPVWLALAYRERFGRGWGRRVVAFMERDLERDLKRAGKP